MGDSVLDIGCGSGRFASALYARPHFFRGRYRGFDVDERALSWADRYVRRPGRNLEFTHVDVANYLRQIGRVLRPGGRALLSFVLVPPEDQALGPVATERLYRGVLMANGLQHPLTGTTMQAVKGVRTVTPHSPEIVTFYTEGDVRAMAEAGGLTVTSVYHGSWSKEDGGPAFQDLVLLTRP